LQAKGMAEIAKTEAPAGTKARKRLWHQWQWQRQVVPRQQGEASSLYPRQAGGTQARRQAGGKSAEKMAVPGGMNSSPMVAARWYSRGTSDRWRHGTVPMAAEMAWDLAGRRQRGRQAEQTLQAGDLQKSPRSQEGRQAGERQRGWQDCRCRKRQAVNVGRQAGAGRYGRQQAVGERQAVFSRRHGSSSGTIPRQQFRQQPIYGSRQAVAEI